MIYLLVAAAAVVAYALVIMTRYMIYGQFLLYT